jgi:hypothetical protein
MSPYTVVVIIAVAGALCLALMAVARRWPGDGRWTGRSQDQDQEVRRVVVHIDNEMHQQALLLILRERFGDLPPAIVTRIESEDAEWCEEMLRRAATVKSLEELGF